MNKLTKEEHRLEVKYALEECLEILNGIPDVQSGPESSDEEVQDPSFQDYCIKRVAPAFNVRSAQDLVNDLLPFQK